MLKQTQARPLQFEDKGYQRRKKNGGCDVHQTKPPAHGKIQTDSWGAFVNEWVGDPVDGHWIG